jgi:peptide/nickel transport system permease protein
MGLIAGYVGGRVDTLLMRLIDMLFAIPSLVLAIVIAGLLGPSLTNAMIAIGIVYAPIYTRLVRGEMLVVRNYAYIEAARAVGVDHVGLILRHFLPNIAAPLIIQTSLLLSTAILAEAALSFLGLGAQPPDPSWGAMLGSGRRFMELTPWVAIAPGIAIVITVLGFNLLGDGLRDALDPRLRGNT